MIVGVVIVRNLGEVFEKIKILKFNFYEVRFDFFESFEGLEVLGEYFKKFIFMLRRREEGGIRFFDDGIRLSFYRRVMEFKLVYVDVEFVLDIV